MDFSIKPCDPTDEGFVRELNRRAYDGVVVEQFGSWDPDLQKEFFDEKWRTQFFSILEIDGVRVGAFSSQRTDNAVTLLEVLLLPEYQNRGIGTQILRRLQEEARSNRVPLLLQVLLLNKAKYLYERLGFNVVETTDTHYRMRWEPTPNR